MSGKLLSKNAEQLVLVVASWGLGVVTLGGAMSGVRGGGVKRLGESRTRGGSQWSDEVCWECSGWMRGGGGGDSGCQAFDIKDRPS